MMKTTAQDVMTTRFHTLSPGIRSHADKKPFQIMVNLPAGMTAVRQLEGQKKNLPSLDDRSALV